MGFLLLLCAEHPTLTSPTAQNWHFVSHLADPYLNPQVEGVRGVPEADGEMVSAQPRSRLEDHMGHCVAEAIAQGGDAADEKIREASDAIARLVKAY
jgi:hypothetical protein